MMNMGFYVLLRFDVLLYCCLSAAIFLTCTLGVHVERPFGLGLDYWTESEGRESLVPYLEQGYISASERGYKTDPSISADDTFCLLEGIVSQTSATSSGLTIAKLPKKCRPAKTLIFNAGIGIKTFRLDIESGGSLIIKTNPTAGVMTL